MTVILINLYSHFSKKTSAQNKNALCIESIKGTGLIEKSDFAQ